MSPKRMCIAYLDNLLVYAAHFVGASWNLQTVFLLIWKARLRLNCPLLQGRMHYLGHVTDHQLRKDGISVGVKELCCFLGLASYY